MTAPLRRRLPLELKPQHPSIRHASFSGDGRRVITYLGPAPHTMREAPTEVWDLSTLSPLARLPVSSPLDDTLRIQVEGVALDCSGVLALVGLGDSTAVLYRVDTAEPVEVLQHPEKSVFPGRTSAVTFTPDGHFALVGLERTVGVWDRNGRLQRFLDPKSAPPTRHRKDGMVQTIRYSPDGDYVFALCWDGASYLWHFPSGELIKEAVRHHHQIVGLSELNGKVIWVTSDGAVWGEDGLVADTESRIERAVFSPGGEEILTYSSSWQTDGACTRFNLMGEKIGSWSSSRGLKRAIGYSGDSFIVPDGVRTVTINRAGVELTIESPGPVRSAAVFEPFVVIKSGVDKSRALVRWYHLPSLKASGEQLVSSVANYHLSDSTLCLNLEDRVLLVDLVSGDRTEVPGSLYPLAVWEDRLIGRHRDRLVCWSLSGEHPRLTWDCDLGFRGHFYRGTPGRLVWLSRGNERARVLSIDDGSVLLEFGLQEVWDAKVIGSGTRLLAVAGERSLDRRGVQEWCLERGRLLRTHLPDGDRPTLLSLDDSTIEAWVWPGCPYPAGYTTAWWNDGLCVNRGKLWSLSNRREVKSLEVYSVAAGQIINGTFVALTHEGELLS